MKRDRNTTHLRTITGARSRTLLTEMQNNLFSILSASFGVAAIAMMLGSTYGPTGGIIGENLVLTEVQVLPGFYMKPITFFTFALFLSFGFGLYTPATRQLFLSAPASVLRIEQQGADGGIASRYTKTANRQGSENCETTGHDCYCFQVMNKAI